jgi:hypothetical protein
MIFPQNINGIAFNQFAMIDTGTSQLKTLILTSSSNYKKFFGEKGFKEKGGVGKEINCERQYPISYHVLQYGI